jgi:putative DNA primase/helicase
MGAPATPRPTALPVCVDGVPTELTARDQWVAWRYDWDVERGEWTKRPYDARTRRLASPTDPATWSPFAAALAAANADGFDGIGYVVSREDPYTGIDLDACRDPATGTLADWAAAIVAAFASYTEITPSGTGIRIWIVGTIIGLATDGRAGRKATAPHKIEVYSGDRFFTVTGRTLEALT